MLFGPDHVSDLKIMVVDRAGEVVEARAVGPLDDVVLFVGPIELDPAADQIFDDQLALPGHLQPDDRLSALGLESCPVPGRFGHKPSAVGEEPFFALGGLTAPKAEGQAGTGLPWPWVLNIEYVPNPESIVLLEEGRPFTVLPGKNLVIRDWAAGSNDNYYFTIKVDGAAVWRHRLAHGSSDLTGPWSVGIRIEATDTAKVVEIEDTAVGYTAYATGYTFDSN